MPVIWFVVGMMTGVFVVGVAVLLKQEGYTSESKRKQYMQASMDDFVIGERFCYDGKLMELAEVSTILPHFCLWIT